MARDDDDDLDEDREDESDGESEDEDENEADPESGRGIGGFAVGLGLGALIGAAAALLLAPAAGHVTRRRLKRKLEHAREIAGEEWDSFRRRAKRELRRRAEALEKSVNGER